MIGRFKCSACLHLCKPACPVYLPRRSRPGPDRTGWQDRDGAKLVLEKPKHVHPRFRLIWADGGYAGQFVDWVQRVCGWAVEIAKRPEGMKEFQVLPRRWVVERTSGWFNRYHYLSKDYEFHTETGEAMIHITVRRLAREMLFRHALANYVEAAALRFRMQIRHPH